MSQTADILTKVFNSENHVFQPFKAILSHLQALTGSQSGYYLLARDKHTPNTLNTPVVLWLWERHLQSMNNQQQAESFFLDQKKQDINPVLWQHLQTEQYCVITSQDEVTSLISELMPNLKSHRLPILLIPFRIDDKLHSIAILTNPSKHNSYKKSSIVQYRTLFESFQKVISRLYKTLEKVPATNTHLNEFVTKSINETPLGMITVDENYKIVLFNPAAANMLRIEADQAIGQSLRKWIPPQPTLSTYSYDFSVSTKQTKNQKLYWENIEALRDGGERFLINITAFQTKSSHNQYFTFYLEDITTHLQNSKAYQRSLHRFKVLTNLAPIAILQLEKDWSCSYANDRWCEYSGLNLDEVLGVKWINAIHKEDLTHTLNALKTTIDSGKEYNIECRLCTPIGKVRWVSIQARALHEEHRQINGAMLCITDISNRLNHEKQLRILADQDELTQLGNRSVFLRRLNEAFEVETCEPIGVFLIDLDGFKDVNDSLGHAAGDELLCIAAKRIQHAIRRSDLVCRLGGDEFTILLDTNLNIENAQLIANNIIKTIAKPIVLNNQEVFVSASIGISIQARDEISPETLLKQSDIAMYHAKESGKNTYRFFSVELENKAQAKIKLDSQLHKAIDHQEFFFEFQPIFRAEPEKLMGFEALLRWQHPEYGVLRPDQFIPRLEETGLIAPVSIMMLKQLTQDYQCIIKAHPNLRSISVFANFSGSLFNDEDTLKTLLKLLKFNPELTSSLTIEITESCLLEHSAHFEAFVNTLKKIGTKIALDDFGTGYCSFSYLKRYEIDYLKIDKSFTQDCFHEGESQSIVKAMIGMAHNLGLQVVAEGVEKKQQKHTLDALNCDLLQGYLYGKPLPIAEIEATKNWNLQHKIADCLGAT